MAFIVFGLIVAVLAAFLLWTWLSGGPYTPIPAAKLARLLAQLDLRPGQRFYDLGSGDGRVLRTAAKHYGVEAVGYELNPVPWGWSVIAGRLSGTTAAYRLNNYFMADVERADVIFLHLIAPGIHRLAAFIRRRARPGTRVVSFGVPLREMGPETVLSLRPEGATGYDLFPDQAYLYQLP